MPGIPRQHQRQVAGATAAVVTISVAQFYALLLLHIVLTRTVEVIRPYNPTITYDSTPFQFDSLDDSEARFRFRFSKEQILTILPYLRLDLIQWSRRYQPDPLTAFCILLRRLAYPERWGSMMRFWTVAVIFVLHNKRCDFPSGASIQSHA
ncbi:hypothetical protein V1520DRAFT_176231 [Lipomyces starkeyi]